MKIFKLKVNDRCFIVKSHSEEAAVKKLKDSKMLDAKDYIINITVDGNKNKMYYKANNVMEALKQLANESAGKGYGTANVYVISAHPDDGYNIYGKLSDILKKFSIKDSCKSAENSNKYMSAEINDSSKLYQLATNLYNKVNSYIEGGYYYNVETRESTNRKLEEIYKLSMEVYSQMKTEVENMKKYGKEIDTRTGKGNPDIWFGGQQRRLLEAVANGLDKLGNQERNQKFIRIADMISDLIKQYRHYAYKDSGSEILVEDSKTIDVPDMLLNELKEYCDMYQCEAYNTGVKGKYRLEGKDVDKVIKELKADGFIMDSVEKLISAKITDSAELYRKANELNKLVSIIIGNRGVVKNQERSSAEQKVMEDIYRLGVDVYNKLRQEIDAMKKYSAQQHIDLSGSLPHSWVYDDNAVFLEDLGHRIWKISAKGTKLRILAEKIINTAPEYGSLGLAVKDSSIKNEEIDNSVIRDKVVDITKVKLYYGNDKNYYEFVGMKRVAPDVYGYEFIKYKPVGNNKAESVGKKLLTKEEVKKMGIQ